VLLACSSLTFLRDTEHGLPHLVHTHVPKEESASLDATQGGLVAFILQHLLIY
jgi:hypothetical protein